MARMMADLEAMRQKDPSTFLSIMQSAGVPSAPPAPPSPGGSGGELPPITPEQLEMFMKLMQQTMGEGQGLDSVNLPGGAASLGPKGVETKVFSLFYILSYFRQCSVIALGVLFLSLSLLGSM